jgi:hypothetical protein
MNSWRPFSISSLLSAASTTLGMKAASTPDIAIARTYLDLRANFIVAS